MPAETEDVRYWKRAGFPVTKDVAMEMVERISTDAIGAVRDDDLEEFVAVGGVMSKAGLIAEIEELFSRPASDEDNTVDESIQWIMEAMAFEGNKKAFLREKKAEGMTIEEAREAYEAEKSQIVRDALDLPPPEETDEEE